jgi:hypothetical protein
VSYERDQLEKIEDAILALEEGLGALNELDARRWPLTQPTVKPLLYRMRIAAYETHDRATALAARAREAMPLGL